MINGNNKKKGFTLVELLGVIVILLLLASIVTPIFVSYIRKSRDDAYDAQIKAIEQSAKNWAAAKENVKFLPTKDGDCVEVTLERLKDSGYLDYNIKNPETDESFPDDMTVVISKSGKNLSYEVNDNNNVTCDSGVVITSEYPKWELVSSTPELATKGTNVTVVIRSDRKIINDSTDKEDITVKVGSNVIENGISSITCSNGDLLECELVLTNLKGSGKLSLVIDKETIQDEHGNYSKRQNLATSTIVDSDGPKVVYVGRSNTNSSMMYATKDDTVTITFKVEKANLISNLTADDIVVYIDGDEITATKTLSSNQTSSKIEYTLTLKNINESGKVSIKVPSGKIEDELGNVNFEKIIAPGITYDNIAPEIQLTPNEREASYSNIDVKVIAKDQESGIREETLKYIYSQNESATPNVQLANGSIVSLSNEDGAWFLIVYGCDNAGNCSTKKSGIYNLNSNGPTITITPNGNSSYAKEATIVIDVESNGIAINDATLKYAVSSNIDAVVNQIYENGGTEKILSVTGELYVIAEACDEQGNCTRKVSNRFLFDNEPPEITYTENGTSGTYQRDVSVTIDVNENVELDYAKYIISTTKTATPTTNLASENEVVSIPNETGTYYVITKACDRLGNCRVATSLPYLIDADGPEIDDITVADTSIATSANDISGLAGYAISSSTTTPTTGWVELSGTSSNISYDNLEVGTYYLHVKDTLGNSSYKAFEITSGSFNYNGNESSCSKEVKSVEIPFTGYYQISLAGANGGDGWFCRSIDGYNVDAGYIFQGEGCVTNEAGVNNYKASEGSAIFRLEAGTTLYYFLGCTGEIGATTAGGGGKWTGKGGWPNGTDATISGAAGSGGSSIVSLSSDVTDTSSYLMTVSGGKGVYLENEIRISTPSLPVKSQVYLSDKYVYNTFTVTENTHTGLGTFDIESVDAADVASYISDPWTFGYTHDIQEFVVPVDGTYKLEVWGAQGGKTNGVSGGKGGYSVGYISLTAGTKLYIGVGGQGDPAQANYSSVDYNETAGGFNGGANGHGVSSSDWFGGGGGGGGATHIAYKNNRGELYNYKDYKNEVLIVAGGGGAERYGCAAGKCCGAAGGYGGGETGGAGSLCHTGAASSNNSSLAGAGATATSGSAFGRATSNSAGGGWYGGYGGGTNSWWHDGNNDGAVQSGGAGGGSGYIGGVAAGSMTSNVKTGNGQVTITYVTDEMDHPIESILTEFNFGYTGAPEIFRAPYTGNYQLEVWGAGGGSTNYGGTAGKGGYKKGTIALQENDILYVVVGGAGTDAGDSGSSTGGRGGYNGGANGNNCNNENGCTKIGGGGGATHIGTFANTLSGHNSDDGLYLVAGGGGGAYNQRAWCWSDATQSAPFCGSQRAGGAGGAEASSTTKWVGTGSGAGGGYYGGSSNNGGSSFDANLLNADGSTGVQSGAGKAKITFLND